MLTNAELTEQIVPLAEAAGREILEVYGATDQGVRHKTDDSPVTAADLRAEALILAGLEKVTPSIPIVAEESVASGRLPAELGAEFWLVDPLDGTKEFLSRNGEFTVNIALVRGGQPVFGVVHAPVLATTYVGGFGSATVTRGGEISALAVVEPPSDGLRVLVSRSHLDDRTREWLEGVRVKERVQAGSSLKFCRIAEGEADLYPRLGRTMEWDTAAGHAVLAAAGGTVRTLDEQPLTYGHEGFANPPFLAYGLWTAETRVGTDRLA